MVRTRAGFAVCSYGVGPCVPVHSSSWAGLLAGSERSGIGGLPHVARVRSENVRYRVYTAQGILERITAQWPADRLRPSNLVPEVPEVQGLKRAVWEEEYSLFRRGFVSELSCCLLARQEELKRRLP